MAKKKQSGVGSLLAILVIVAIVVFAYLPTGLLGYFLWNNLPNAARYPKFRKTMLIWATLAILILGGFSTFGLIYGFTGLETTALDSDSTKPFFDFSTLFASWGLGLIFSGIAISRFFGLKKRQTALQEEINAYANSLAEALADGVINKEEKTALENVRSSSDFSSEAIRDAHHDAFLNVLYSMSEDGVVDDDELQKLTILAAELDIQEDIKAYAEEFSTHVNLLHRIQQGILPEACADDAGYFLKKDELCFFCEKTDLYEETTQVAFGGASISLGKVLPLTALLNPRIYIGHRIPYNLMKHIDCGYFIITSKRAVFIGDKITREFSINKILGISVREDAVQINREGKQRREIFKITALSKDIAAAIIHSLANDSK